MLKILKSILNKLPYIRTLHKENKILKSNSRFPAGHFYSPIVSINDLKEKEDRIWGLNEEDENLKISMNIDCQRQLLNEFKRYYKDLPFGEYKTDDRRYYFNNKFYSYTDGIVLYSMIRHVQPKRIIEIGSGFSSAVMMDTNQLFFNNMIELVFIEPFPERLNSLMSLKDKENFIVIEDSVQNLDVLLFKKLEKNDILFIDSSHIVKTGSDVNFILFNILPILNSGVIIHFHDIFYPFEYPKKWVLRGFNWNEIYFVKAFMMYNKAFKIILFSSFIHFKHKDAFEGMPLAYLNTGGNFWIEKQ